MNIELTLKKLSQKHGFEFEWQQMQFGARRAAIPCGSYRELDYIYNTLRRVKGLKVTTWVCADGGFFEGAVLVMDTAEAERLNAASAAEQARLDAWWMRYHNGDAETRRLMACGAIA